MLCCMLLNKTDLEATVDEAEVLFGLVDVNTDIFELVERVDAGRSGTPA